MKKFVIVFIMILCLGVCFVNSYGVDAIVNLNSDKKTVHPYEEVFVNVDMQSLQSFETLNGGMECYLEYDKNVFEKITQNSIALYNLNINFSYDEVTNRLLVFKDNFKNDNCIIKLRFKVKEDAKKSVTDIKVNNLKVFDGNNNVLTGNSKISMKIEDPVINNFTPIITSNAGGAGSTLTSSVNTDELNFSVDKYSNILNSLQNNIGFLKGDGYSSVINMITQPFYLILIFAFGYFAVVIINIVLKYVLEGIYVRKEIFRSRRTNRRLRKVFLNLEKYQ